MNNILVINDMNTNGEKTLVDSRWNPIYWENMIYTQNLHNKVRSNNWIALTSRPFLSCSISHRSVLPQGEKILPINNWVQINKSLPHKSDHRQGEKILPAGDWIQFIKSLPHGSVLPQNIYP